MAQLSYYEDDLAAERQPLGHPGSISPRYPPQQQQEYRQQYHQQQQYPDQEPRQRPKQDPFASPGRVRPGAHPDSSFESLREHRRYSQEPPRNGSPSRRGPGPYGPAAAVPQAGYSQPGVVSPASPPPPPPHRGAEQRYWGQEAGSYPPRARPAPPRSTITPGADNFSNAAVGGMAGIALTVAEHNARESGLNAIDGPNYPQQTYQQDGQWQNQNQGGYNGGGGGSSLGVGDHQQRQPGAPYSGVGDTSSHSSFQSSFQGSLAGHAIPARQGSSRSPHSTVNEIYTDDPYQHYGRPQDPRLGVVDPHDIEDDGDDGLTYGPRKGPRTSMLSLGSSHRGAAAAGGAAGGAAAGGVLSGLGGRNGSGGLSGFYAPVKNGSGAPQSALEGEKPAWPVVPPSSGKSRKWRLVVIIIVAVLIAIGIALGVVFGLVLKNNGGGNKDNSTGGSTSTAAGDTAANGDLDINSKEIKALLNNGNLYKVFPGIDYTPVNSQYPDCLKNPPSQNNVTRDVAVLSQLSNTIRLYGTDCNQTEMVIHALRRLEMDDTIKIWLGVWQDANTTTNKRQLDQMWDILDTYGEKPFKGLIVANEILFREQMTVDELGTLLKKVRSGVADRKMSLPVATSDLGDKWTAALAAESDYVMANIHPFFSGTKVAEAAVWTNQFWNNVNGPIFKSDPAKNIISETGWPSQGGTNCGSDKVFICPDQAVAGITEMNRFMKDWVCGALANGTEYFWFEAFDEPWKVTFNTKDQQWEDHWGLMDVNRNLKDGVQIPDCGGKTVD
ncbi:glycoside hydrolase family 17 protein [Podospora didyma]|uniref:glucan endo-1,3-beta-D-glucosidase n=1 Tax=Podospora didyma TaxID=330526 RepID=A0AAE0P5W8_9PEZI|nr:glycoside hydrolase family 17 protein [Podospora didyma]